MVFAVGGSSIVTGEFSLFNSQLSILKFYCLYLIIDPMKILGVSKHSRKTFFFFQNM